MMRSLRTLSVGFVPSASHITAPLYAAVRRLDSTNFFVTSPAVTGGPSPRGSSSPETMTTPTCSSTSATHSQHEITKMQQQPQDPVRPTSQSIPQESPTLAARKEKAESIAAKLDSDPNLVDGVLEKLSGNKRRYLLVASAASEWHGAGSVRNQLTAADHDRDQVISPNDYHLWIHRSLLSARQSVVPAAIPWAILLRVAFVAACPFVAFGVLDNTVMLLSGDAIDSAFGSRFHLSAMGAAALGGICSGVLGIQMHGFAERLVHKVVAAPNLTPSQSRTTSAFRAGHIGGSVGMAVGLLIGMWPLYFLKSDTETE